MGKFNNSWTKNLTATCLPLVVLLNIFRITSAITGTSDVIKQVKSNQVTSYRDGVTARTLFRDVVVLDGHGSNTAGRPLSDTAFRSDTHSDNLLTRNRRTLFDSNLQRQIVDKHNELRRIEYSSNMEYMIWSDYLADMAEDWGKRCVWEHGQPFRDPTTLPFQDIGQNLYAYNGTFDPIRGIQLWFDEYEFYDYDTGACSKDPCGHYTQMVWDTSREIGCAYVYCPQMFKVDLINANYLVCNYGPTGNWIGQKPYEKGPGCKRCETGHMWCDQGLCRRDCSRQSTECTCDALCENCGNVDRAECSCMCQPGWRDIDCSAPCVDGHEYCGVLPGWPKSWCDRGYVRDNCPALCDLCVKANSTTTSSCTTSRPASTPRITRPTPPPSHSNDTREILTDPPSTTNSSASTGSHLHIYSLVTSIVSILIVS